MSSTGILVPLELVTVVVLGLVAAIGWLARRYDKAIERTTGEARTDRRRTAIMLREALRERDPDLDPLSLDEDSALFEREHNKDVEAVRRRSGHPSELPPRQERRVERYARTGDPSTPPDPVVPYRKKTPSRRDED